MAGRKGPGRDSTSASAIETRNRHASWVRARLAGQTYREIAEAEEVAISTVQEAVVRRLHETVAEPCADLRAVEVARLDAQLGRLTAATAIPAEDEVIHAKAEELLLKVADRRAKLLGLDAPTKLQDVTPPREEIAATVMALLENPTEEFAKMLEKTGWVRK